MTLKTSFFNKAVYKSTVKRCAWGSVLYAILLFLSSGFAVILASDSYRGMETAEYYDVFPMILDGGYLAFPLLLSVVVPSVTALLCFRFLHSKKQATFIHSMPVSRRSNFVSTILAAFTLMLAPVLINALILIFQSLFGYGDYFSVSDCLVWLLYNAYPLFLMFSAAVLAASITGTGYAMAAINILIHTFLIIIVSNIGSVAQYFLYGYTGSNAITETLFENNFIAQAVNVSSRYDLGGEKFLEMLLFSLTAVIIYFIAYVMYKHRKIESVGNVAGFNCLNAVFKYAACLIATLVGFVIFSSLVLTNTLAFVVIILIFSCISYAACEMLFKKTTKVLYAWRGYVVFAALFTAMILFFANTSFFGYETRVPDKADIAKSSIVGSEHGVEVLPKGDTYTDDPVVADLIRNIHSEIVSDIPDNMFELYYSDSIIYYLSIEYELKDGSFIKRHYQLPKEQYDRLMDTIEDNENYLRYSRKH